MEEQKSIIHTIPKVMNPTLMLRLCLTDRRMKGRVERKMRGTEEKEEQKIIIFGFDFSQFCFL